MPAALLTTVTGIMIGEVSGTLKLWIIKETAYPFKSLAIVYGLNPVIAMWILKFTFRRFWLFIVVEIVFNLGFSYLVMGYFMQNRGIIQNLTMTPFLRTIITT